LKSFSTLYGLKEILFSVLNSSLNEL
jgi:hypothetical protein